MPYYYKTTGKTVEEQVLENKERLDDLINNGLVGYQGIRGEQGIQGPQGPTGAQGVQGIQGPQGLQGIQGLDGTPVAGTVLNSVADTTLGGYSITFTGTPTDIQKRYIFNITLSSNVAVSVKFFINNIEQTKRVSTLDFFWIRTYASDYMRAIYYDETGESIEVANESTADVWKLNYSGQFSMIEIMSNASTVGPQGIQGIQGPTGPQGAQGIQGEHGIQGEQGIQGIQGEKGDVGPTGPKGDTGANGNTPYIGTDGYWVIAGINTGVRAIGAQGPIGPQGIQGPTGARGLQGVQGLTGPTGVQGVQGIQGPKGDKGNTGDSGKSFEITNTVDGVGSLPTPSINYVGQAYAVGITYPRDIYICEYDDDSSAYVWQNEGQLEGPIGPQGPTGSQGPTGPQGIQGIQGPTGSQGIQGEQGDAATVAAGTVTTGDPGTPAAVVNAGDSHAAIFNFTIPQGAQGAQGIQGIPGGGNITYIGKFSNGQTFLKSLLTGCKSVRIEIVNTEDDEGADRREICNASSEKDIVNGNTYYNYIRCNYFSASNPTTDKVSAEIQISTATDVDVFLTKYGFTSTTFYVKVIGIY